MSNASTFDWNDLRYFLAVARHGSTLAAARALKVSHSTVHRRIEALERGIGHKLVKRRSTGYRLTELGQQMRSHAERIEDAAIAFERHLAATGTQVAGVLRVTCPEAFGYRLMRSSLMNKFSSRFPSLRVEFVTSDRSLDVSRGEAEIAIRGAEPMDDALVRRKICDAPWAIYASRSYVARHGHLKRVEDMDGHAIVVFGGDMADHKAVRWLHATAPQATIAARCSNLPALILAVKSGVGLAALPVAAAENEHELIRVLGPIPDLAAPFYLVIHTDHKKTPRVRAAFDFFVEELSEIRTLLMTAVKSNAREIQS